MGLNLGPPGLRCDYVDLADWGWFHRRIRKPT
jgi:hypothetical protein